MRTVTLHAICLVALTALSGCAAGYKMMSHHRVVTKQTKQGLEPVIVGEGYIAYREVIERSPNVKSVTRMTDLKGVREPAFFDVSPDGKWLVYQALEREESTGTRFLNLWRISTGGGAAVTRLTAGRYLDMEPGFSAEGLSIYFASNRSSRLPKIWRVSADGAGGIARLTQAESEDRWPAAAPGGEQVYYTSRPFNAVQWQLWRIGVGGNLPTQLREGRGPKISPDGQRVLHSVRDNDTGRFKIWVMNTDGSNQTQLTSDPDSDDTHPNWSANGEKIVYASNIGKDSNGKRNFDIWVMNADGSHPTQLTTNGSTDYMPVYGAEGNYIYFVSNRGFHWDIWRMEIVEAAR